MSGYATYTRWQRIEDQAKTLGFRLGNPRHSNWSGLGDTDLVALYPDGEALPVFGRDADIFTGTFGQVETFLAGWARAQQYDMMLHVSDNNKRKKYEARELVRQAEQRKQEEQAELVKVLRASDAENRGKK